MSPTITLRPPQTDHYASTGNYLDVEVRRIMTPGVVTISEESSLRDAYRALVGHMVHSVLVVGHTTGKPLGWVTARGLLSWLTKDPELVRARDAITHPPATIQPDATAREAFTALAQPGISQLLVASRPDVTPQGVLSDLDMVALAAS